nr:MULTISPECIES: glutathione S-transferase N-terminal domain-containing protein [unclassified Mesorhizobium]
MLEELGQPYEFVEVKLRSPEAYALNPSGKVPILIDGELIVTDSRRSASISPTSTPIKAWVPIRALRAVPRWIPGCILPRANSRRRCGTNCAIASSYPGKCGSSRPRGGL